MKDLLDSDGESGMQGDGDTLRINEDYKRKYDERKRKEALSRAKELLKSEGQGDEGLSESESESSEEDEDSDADLLDFKTQDKILETLDRIKRRDPSIYDRSHVIFPESESEDDSEVESGKSGSLREKKPMTFRDYERRVLLESEEGADDESKVTKRGLSKKLGYDKEQDELKQAFLKAAEGLEDSGDESSATLVKKDKTKEELEEEERTFRSFLTRNIEEGGDPIESLNRYWGPEEDLDENERFLRNYILNQEWKECNSKTRINDEASSSYVIQTELDEEDEKHIEMSNEFESVYNFRYEEPGSGQQIMSYSRNISSLRKPDDRRKQKRKERRERKAEERLRMEEELKLLKSWKRKEIIEKLKRIQEVSGNSRISDEGLDLEAEFDPEKHDKYMEELFDDKYEEEKESLSLSEMLENINEDEDKQPDEDRSLKRETKPKVEEESVGDDEEWWQCDGCMKEILPNKKKFDCTVCENYTLCKSCCRNTDHEHPLEKSRVPESKSRDQGLNESDIEEMASNNRLNLSYGEDEKINSLLDEYYGLHFEDVLDNGKMPVRFKYTRVEKNDYGLSVEDILSMNDKELNQHISLKKLAPYRIDKKRKYPQPARFSREAKTPNKMSKKHQNKGHSKHARSNDKSNSSIAHINKHRLESYY